MPVWRAGEDGRPISVIITRAGRDAIGVEEAVPVEAQRPSNERPKEKEALGLKSDRGTVPTTARRRRAPGRSGRW